jgi:hypothetical protein
MQPASLPVWTGQSRHIAELRLLAGTPTLSGMIGLPEPVVKHFGGCRKKLAACLGK